MTYSIKVQLPGVKKTEAVDIDDYDEYKELAKNIIEQQPTKMNIFVDMAIVEKRWSGRGFNRGSDNEDGEDAGLYDSNGLSEVDRELARMRRKLEVKYQNGHNAGYTYIDPDTAESYELTPTMMKEWARAMYDGVATVERPVSLGKVTFHPAKRQVALHRVNSPQGAGGVSDIGHLANLITTIFGATSAVKSTQPSTPQKSSHTESHVPDVVNSPPVPTPSKLSKYLEHAETKLGVSNTRMFETGLRENGYGPDILHLVDNKDPEGLGISKGNVIRLKAGAQNWWKSSDAKRKRTESESAGNSGTAGIGQDVTVTPSKRVAYEVRYKDGGSSRLFGPRLSPGLRLQFPDREVYYAEEQRREMMLGWQQISPGISTL
ncbi:hypothetical protein R3P38DRAFT_3502227 [Favolaschia claudopus]|uniref:Uncharacterized protein n=1 Tax=Favolaschia claudopus TaxID=2862362 RepID=A0AAV9Z2M6_9AGAR